MRTLALLVALAFTGSLVADDKKVKDEEAILGTWKVVEFDNGGAPGGRPKDEVGKMRFTFKKDGKVETTDGTRGGTIEDEYKLDPTTKPKAIDLIAGKRTAPGIYELDGDTLKMCIAEGSQAVRPTEMKPDGKRVSVITLKRVKEDKKDK